MKKPVLIIASLLILSPTLFAQDSLSGINKKYLWVQYNPFSLFEPDIPIAATVLYQPTNRFGFALESGVFLGTRSEVVSTATQMRGFKLRPAVKFYFSKERLESTRFYISLQSLFKFTWQNKTTWQDVLDPSTGQVLYSKLFNYKEKKSVTAGSVVLGVELMADKKEKRWLIDIYAGLGLRSKNYQNIGLPSNVSAPESSDLFYVDQQLLPNIVLGATVGYRIF